jgi:hypothetical protein
MSLEHSPARTGALFGAPDVSLTISEFCRAENQQVDAVQGVGRRLGPEVLQSGRDAPHHPSSAS